MCLLFAHQIAREKIYANVYTYNKNKFLSSSFNIMNNYIFITAAGITMSLSEVFISGCYFLLFKD